MTITALPDQLQRGFSHPLFPGLAIAALGFVILAGAYAFEYIGGLKPCPLCLEQRVPWFILIALGGAIAGASSAKAPRVVLLTLYAAAIAVGIWGAYLGGYHAGVEYKWWLGPQTCSGTLTPSGDGGLLGNLSSSEIVRCDEIPWAMFGISLAGFNFLFSLLAIALAGLGLRAALPEGR